MHNQPGSSWLLQEYSGQPLSGQAVVYGQPLSIRSSSPGGAPQPSMTRSQFKTPFPSHLPVRRLSEQMRQSGSQFKTPVPANRPVSTLDKQPRQPGSQFKTPAPPKGGTQVRPGPFQVGAYSMP